MTPRTDVATFDDNDDDDDNRTDEVTAPDARNSVDLDPLNLEQALIDFEVANARVIDLTRRLTEMNRQLTSARNELEETRVQLRVSEGARHQLEASRAYQLAQRLGVARSLLRR